MLGQLHKLDDMILNATSEDFKKIQQAVDEYNNKFSLPEFVFRVSTAKLGTTVEILLLKLEHDTSWKEVVYREFKIFADEVLSADAKYTIDCIQVNDKTVFTEFEYYDANKSLKKARIVADIGVDGWSVYYLNHDIYEL